MPAAVYLFLLAFLLGSIPFSVWLARLFARQDVRRYGDGNPGAVNAFKAGGQALGISVLMLDILKGVPFVYLAYHVQQLRGAPMLLIATAPVLGHAFSPFLRFRGGKSLGASLGVWIGLAFWQAPLVVMACLVAWYALLDSDAWPVMLALASLLAFLLWWRPEPVLLGALAGQALLLGWKLRAGLARRPHLRPWLLRQA